MLVLGVTNDVAQEIRTLVRRVNMLEGVIEVKSTKYWVESPGRLVGLMNVEVHRSADPKQVRTTIQHICSNTFQEVVVQVDQDPSIEWMDYACLLEQRLLFVALERALCHFQLLVADLVDEYLHLSITSQPTCIPPFPSGRAAQSWACYLYSEENTGERTGDRDERLPTRSLD